MADYYVDFEGNITQKKKKKKQNAVPDYSVDFNGNVRKNTITVPEQHEPVPLATQKTTQQASKNTLTVIPQTDMTALQKQAEQNVAKQFGTYEEFAKKNSTGKVGVTAEASNKISQTTYKKLIEEETNRLASGSEFYGITNEEYREYLDNFSRNAKDDNQKEWLETQKQNLETLKDSKIRSQVEKAVYANKTSLRKNDGSLIYALSKNLKISYEQAESLYDTVEREQNAEHTQTMLEKADELTDKGLLGKAGAQLLSVGANMTSTLSFLESFLQNEVNTVKGTYEPLDTNSFGYMSGKFRDQVRGNIEADIEGEGGSVLRKGLGILYQGATSSFDSLSQGLLLGPAGGLTAMASQAAGSSTVEAFERTGSNTKAFATGLTSGLIEAATEKMGLDNMWDILQNSGKAAMRSKLVNVLGQMAIEAGEEMTSEVLNTITDRIINTTDSNWTQNKQSYKASGMTEKEAFNQTMKDTVQQVLLAGAGGAAGGLFGSISSTMLSTGFTKNEQKVIDAEVDARVAEKSKNGKVSAKQKSDIRKAVESDIAKGYIDIDTIEKTLGGDTLQKYNSVVEQEETLTRQLKELGEKPNTVANAKQYEELSAKLKELQEKGEKNTLKEQLSKEVSDLTINDRLLRESYNEKGRRSQAFTADVSRYQSNQQDTIQRAIDSGILNNTNRTHEFVDWIAKLSADKGVSFDFTNNEKLKESGFAKEGVSVNGYVQDGKVVLNVNSAKALNQVVGHEITHVLEGSELYAELQEAVKVYATTKGEYQSKLEALAKLYEGMEDVNIEQEATADFIGEYLFTDEAFVRQLSVQNHNIFQKIYDEIKYLVKSVTSGSKEAKQLEKVKKLFEEVYREDVKSTNKGMLYSLAEIQGEKGDYGIGVVLDTDIFNGVKPRDWNKIVREHVYNNMAGETLIVYNNGEAEKIYLAKKNERVTKDGGNNSRKVLDKLARSKNGDNIRNLSVVHIDELAEVSKYSSENLENVHQWLDENGWEFRTTYAQDKKGRIYEMTLNIAKSRDGRNILYDINNIKEIDHGDVASKGLAHKNQSLNSSISQNQQNTTENLKFSLTGKDENGIEVYETSEETKKLSYSERNKLLLKSVLEDYKGRTAKFYKNGDAYYALYNEQGIRKGVYGDKKSDLNGRKAKTNIGADGNYIELAENALYTGTSTEQGKQTNNNFHSDAKTWDYYEKTIKSDGKYYDVLINVKDTGNEQYVYDITLKEVSLPHRTNLYKRGKLTSSNSISQKQQNATENQKFSLSEFKEKQLEIVLENNSAQNEYSTWIRDVDDIMTYEEALNSDDYIDYKGEDFDPTYPYSIAENALETGEIMVYSSYPIKQGIWVSPSFLEAQSYSGTGKVYSEKVKLTDVAWVDPTQGQYAKVTDNVGNNSDVRYSLSANKDIDGMSEKEYNHHGWAKVNDVLTQQELADFQQKVGEKAKNGQNWYMDLEDGRYMFAVGRNGVNSTLIISDGDFQHPSIDKVYHVGLDNETDIEVFRDEIYSREKNGKWSQPSNVIEERFRDGIIREYGKSDFLTLQELWGYDGGIGTEGEGNTGGYGNLQNGRGSNQKTRIDFSVSDKVSSEDGIFFDGKNADGNTDGWNVRGEDIALEDIGPVREDIVQKKTELPNDGGVAVTSSLATSTSSALTDSIPQSAENSTQNSGKFSRSEYHKSLIDNMKSKFEEQGYDFDEMLAKAKNKSAWSSVDNTPQRLIQKTFGYRQGDILNDLTVNKVAQNETEAIRWLNGYTDKKSGLLAQLSRQYNIKPGSKESAAAQMYGEGFYVNKAGEYVRYGDAELAKDFIVPEVQENIRSLAKDPRIRQIYDETLQQINESRKRNGYDEIPRRKDYFLHFQAMGDTFSRMGIPFNSDMIKANNLPTDLNGVTADLKPGQPYFASSMQRKGIRTTYDLLGGVERYLGGAKNQIFHIDDIQNLRALRNYIADMYGQAKGLENLDNMSEEEVVARIRDVYKGHLSNFASFLTQEANTLAGKTMLVDRAIEGLFGRKGISILNTINQQVGSNMVGGNVSSALTNFGSAVIAMAKGKKSAVVKSLAQTVTNRVGMLTNHQLDNFTEENSLCVRRKGAEKFYQTPYDKIKNTGFALAGLTDDICTEFIARVKYNELISQGVDESVAHYEADKWGAKILGDRSYGQQPLLFNSKMLGLVTKFQLEVRNNLDNMFYDTIQETKVENADIQNQLKKNAVTAAKTTATLLQLVVFNHLFGSGFEKMVGYNPTFDLAEIIMTLFGLDDEEESEDSVLDNVEQAFLALLDDMPYSSTFTGGRIPINSALPITEWINGTDQYGNDQSRFKTIAEALPYYILPTGYGQLKKSVQGLRMFDSDLTVTGSYTNNSLFDSLDKNSKEKEKKLRFPVEDTVGNRINAGLFGQYANENAREYFDEERQPLSEKKTKEFAELDIPISEYWSIQDGMKNLTKIGEKADYIAGLDLPVEKKNILINNQTTRDDPIDLTDYSLYNDLDEMDFAIKNPGEYSIAKATGGYEAYKGYQKALNNIHANKDSNGNAISGSRKEKVIDYLNGLTVDYGTRMILYRQQFNGDSTYNQEIVEYLDGREDMSYSEKEKILTELGFTVESDGTVRWKK